MGDSPGIHQVRIDMGSADGAEVGDQVGLVDKAGGGLGAARIGNGNGQVERAGRVVSVRADHVELARDVGIGDDLHAVARGRGGAVSPVDRRAVLAQVALGVGVAEDGHRATKGAALRGSDRNTLNGQGGVRSRGD